jgi:hypothetical protein
VIRIGRPPRRPRRWLGLLADIAAQTALGFGLALIAVAILVRDVWI